MRHRPVLRTVAILIILAIGSMLYAQTNPPIRYFYDDLGRLVQVIDQTGNSANYSYDAVGNILQITRSAVAPGALAVLNFNPQQPAWELQSIFKVRVSARRQAPIPSNSTARPRQ